MRIAAASLAMLLCACSSGPTEGSYPSAPTHSPVAAAPVQRDQCGAAEVQNLLGRPRTEIPIPLDPGRQRVACTTCPVTMDYSPERLNFFFDAATGAIKEIRCG